MGATLFIIILAVFAVGFAALFFINTRKRHTGIPAEDKGSGELSREELLFTIGMLCSNRETEVWDYDLQNDRFRFLRIDDSAPSPLDGFSLDRYLACIDPDDRHIVTDSVRKFRSREIVQTKDTFRIRQPGAGEYRWVDAVVKVNKRDAAGNPLTLAGCWWDITDDMEHERKQQEDKAMLQIAMRASALVPWSFDLGGENISSNSQTSQFFQQNLPINKYIDNLVYPDDQDLFREQLHNIVTHKTREVDFKVRVRYDEIYEWAHIVGKVVDDLPGCCAKVVGTRTVITKDVEREKELEALRRKAEEANRQKSAFLANMGHEIRTPLNAIVGFSRLLTEEGGSEESREYCHIIETNTELLMQLVGDILDMAKIEAGLLEFNYTEVDLCRLLENMEQTYEMKVQKQVKLICLLPDEAWPLHTDRNRLMQVIANLLNNAVKYTSEGSITLGYDHLPEGKGVRIFVRDTGKGIEPENLPTVFDRFAKFDPEIPGTGLGLSICHTIIEHLGGEIGVESEPGKGSEFWFTLPAKQA